MHLNCYRTRTPQPRPSQSYPRGSNDNARASKPMKRRTVSVEATFEDRSGRVILNILTVPILDLGGGENE